MHGLSKILSDLGYSTTEEKQDILHLLFLAGCFQKEVLAADLQASGFTLEEIDGFTKRLASGDEDWISFKKLRLEHILPESKPEQKDRPNPGPHETIVSKSFNWLNRVISRTLLSTDDQQWVNDFEHEVREITNRLAEKEVLKEKAALLAQDELKKHDNAYQAVIIPGGRASDLEDRCVVLATLMKETPISTNIVFLPTHRYTTYKADGQSFIRQRLPVAGKDDIQTEYQCAMYFKNQLDAHVEQAGLRRVKTEMLNPSMPSAPPLVTPIATPAPMYPAADTAMATTDVSTFSPDTFLDTNSTSGPHPLVKIEVIDPKRSKTFYEVIRRFRQEGNFGLHSILVISSANDKAEHEQALKDVFGDPVVKNVIAISTDLVDVLNRLGNKVTSAYDNYLITHRPASLWDNKTVRLAAFTFAICASGAALFGLYKYRDEMQKMYDSVKMPSLGSTFKFFGEGLKTMTTGGAHLEAEHLLTPSSKLN